MAVEPVLVTAAYGEPYRWALGGLIASLAESNPSHRLLAFADEPIPGVETVRAERDAYLAGLPNYYHHPRRKNVMKFALVSEAMEKTGAQSALWLDADTLVFMPLDGIIQPNKVNVCQHGGRNNEVVDCGGGLQVSGSRYAIGSPWGIPNEARIGAMIETLLIERLEWTDADAQMSGDQIMINHLVSRLSDDEVSWMHEQTPEIVNYSIAHSKRHHPVAEKSAYSHLRLRNGLFAGNRRVGIWTWTAPTLFAHREQKFKALPRRVRRYFLQLYSANSKPAK